MPGSHVSAAANVGATMHSWHLIADVKHVSATVTTLSVGVTVLRAWLDVVLRHEHCNSSDCAALAAVLQAWQRSRSDLICTTNA